MSVNGLLISAHDEQELNRVNSLRGVGSVCFQWIVTALCVYIATQWPHPAIVVSAIVIIATRQHAMGALMHEAAHSHLVQNAKLGHWISEIFLAFPFGITTVAFRKRHLLHHRYTWTDQDPDYQNLDQSAFGAWPKTKREALTIFVRDLCVLNFKDSLKFASYWSPWPVILKKSSEFSMSKPWIATFIAYQIAGLSLIFHFGWLKEVLLFWYLPQLTFMLLFVRIRTICEHMNTPNRSKYNNTRYTSAGFFERIFLAPNRINFHLQHHLFPAVPYYNLPELHDILMKHETYRTEGEFAKGYLHPKTGAIQKLIVRESAVSKS